MIDYLNNLFKSKYRYEYLPETKNHWWVTISKQECRSLKKSGNGDRVRMVKL